jgi:hypothetical protein
MVGFAGVARHFDVEYGRGYRLKLDIGMSSYFIAIDSLTK